MRHSNGRNCLISLSFAAAGFVLMASLFSQASAAPPQQAKVTVQGEGQSKRQEIPSRYRYVLTSTGIDCGVEEPSGKTRTPVLGAAKHFECQCSTDTDCMLMNPHRHEYSGELYPDVVAKAPKGTTCMNPVHWAEAWKHIGQTLVVVGPVLKVTKYPAAKGSPTWIDVGAKFPDKRRVTLVIWGDQIADFPMVKPSELEGKYICVVGRIASYKGAAQIVMRMAEQYMVGR